MIGAPLSIACEAWAWRSQCGEVSGLPPARLTLALTTSLMRRAVIGNTRSDAEASPRMAWTLCCLGRQQHVARLVALADERQLDLARVTRDDLGPGQRGDLRDPQGAVVADLEKDPLAPRFPALRMLKLSSSVRIRCASWRGAFLILIIGDALKRV